MKINMPWARFFKSQSSQAVSSLPLPSAPQAAEPVSAELKNRKLHVYCDGGFGNRFNALVTGIVLAERSGLELEVVWPVNGRCGARFSDVFLHSYPVVEGDLAAYAADNRAYQFFLSETDLQEKLASQSLLEFSSEVAMLEAISASDKSVFLSTPLIPACLSLDDVLRVVRGLPIKPEVTTHAEAFIAQNFPGPFYGLQICKSESGSQEVDDEKLFALVKSLPTHRFFVCSDDRAVETRYSALPNVAVYPKTACVTDAAVELLILSHSQVVRTTGSTLLAVALLLQASRKPVSEAHCQPEATSQQPSPEPETVPAVAAGIFAPGKMSLPLFETIRDMGLPAPKGVLQVGAGFGQEMQYFLLNGIRRGLFIEPLQEPYAHLASVCRQLSGFVAVQALCAEESGYEYAFNIASNAGASSSMLKPFRHLQVHGDVKFNETVQMVSNTLDRVADFVKEYGHAETMACLDTLYMDTQGAELSIMLGGTRTLRQINYIYTAIMRAELFEGQPSFQSVCAWLDVMGFTLNNAYFGPRHTGHALFVRKSLLGL